MIAPRKPQHKNNFQNMTIEYLIHNLLYEFPGHFHLFLLPSHFHLLLFRLFPRYILWYQLQSTIEGKYTKLYFLETRVISIRYAHLVHSTNRTYNIYLDTCTRSCLQIPNSFPAPAYNQTNLHDDYHVQQVFNKEGSILQTV